MSYTEMYAVNQAGDVHEVADFRNAFRGAWLVWDQMCKRYLRQDAALLMAQRDGKGMQQVWDLWKDEALPLAHRIVMMSTFDKVMVRRENLHHLIGAIEEYAKEFDPGTLLDQAEKMRELEADAAVLAICWNATSVNCDSWWTYNQDDDEDEGRPYNINVDKGHWFLFNEIIANAHT